MGFCKFSMFCCSLLCVHSSFAIILMGKRELVGLLCLSSWSLAIVVCLFLAVQRVCLQFVIVVFSDNTHLLFCVLTSFAIVVLPNAYLKDGICLFVVYLPKSCSRHRR